MSEVDLNVELDAEVISEYQNHIHILITANNEFSYVLILKNENWEGN
ncbi:hypothetical protein [Rossellomorea marisflavi]